MSDDWLDDPNLTSEQLRAKLDELWANAEPVEIAPGPPPVSVTHQCFADIQSAHPYRIHDHVVTAPYFDPDNDLVGELIIVQDHEPEGPVCVGRIIEQNQGLIKVAIKL